MVLPDINPVSISIGDSTHPLVFQKLFNVSGSMYVDGDFNVKGSKNFMIPDPIKPGYNLVHAAIEGPEAAVYYRGESRLSNGLTMVVLPEYFEALTKKEGRTVLLTPKFESLEDPLSSIAASSVVDGKFMVRVIDNNNLIGVTHLFFERA